MQLKLFGTPTVLRDEQSVSGFISNKTAALFYYLVATAKVHTRTALATLLWDQWSDADAKRNLRTSLHNLRQLFGAFIAIDHQTIAIPRHADLTVDCWQFDDAWQSAQKLTKGSSAWSTTLAGVVDLYNSGFMSGFPAPSEPYEEWLRESRLYYRSCYFEALGSLIEDAIVQKFYPLGMTYGRLLLREDPLYEAGHRQLMLLLTLTGQPQAALAQFDLLEETLEQELNVSPSDESFELRQQILSGKFALPGNPISLPVGDRQITHNLPIARLPVIGRDAESKLLLELFQKRTARLVTLTGPGGVGKTRLALHVGERLLEQMASAPLNALAFPDGIYFVPLEGLEPTAEVASLLSGAVVDALQIPQSRQESTFTQVVNILRTKRALLILDNIEHLAAAAAWIVSLLDQTEQLCLLLTSQKRLNVRGEQVVAIHGLAVPPLPEDKALQDSLTTARNMAENGPLLFLHMARMVNASFTPTLEDAVAIQQICNLVEGLPLGIELAAAWTHTLSCAEIAEELQASFDFLAGGPIDLPERHRSLRAIFDYSWHLLDATEQTVLARLSCLRGSFTREAALQISGAALPQLASLMDRTLLRRDEGQLSAPYAPKIRYTLLETVRQFAAEQLALRGEAYATEQRHADFFTLLLARHLSDLLGGKQREAVYEIHSQIENIRFAWQWCEENLATHPALIAYVARSLDPLFHFWDTRSNFQEGEAAFARMANQVARLMAQEQDHFALVHAKLTARQGWFAFHMDDPNAQTLLLRSLESLHEMGEAQESIFPLNYLGAIAYHRGEHTAAKSYLTQALALTQHFGDKLGESIALNILGQIAIQNGELDEAERLCEAAIALKRKVSDQRGLIFSLANLGRIALATANYPAALRYFEESQTVCLELGDQRGQAFALRSLGDTFAQLDNRVAARQYYAASLEIYQRIGNLREAQETQAKQDGLTS